MFAIWEFLLEICLLTSSFLLFPDVEYLTADNLAVLPENSAANVTALAASLGYDLDSYFTLEATPESTADFKLPFPTPCSVRELLTSYLDIQGQVKHTTMKHLKSYVEDVKQKLILGVWLKIVWRSAYCRHKVVNILF